MREGPLARACVSTRFFLQPLGPFVLSCLLCFRDDSVNSALLMVLVCGLEGAELLRCHAIAGRAGNYFCAVMVAVAAAPEPTTSCS